jgi:hypothetical protein
VTVLDVAAREHELEVRRKIQGGIRPSKPEWHPPPITGFWAAEPVLAFDPSLLHTGWVKFVCLGPRFHVQAHGTINLKTGAKSYLGTWDLACQLEIEIDAVALKHYPFANVNCEVVVEAPSVGGGSRTESSLIAGLQVWQHRRFSPRRKHAIAANHISQVLCGNPRHDKKEIAEAVLRYIPESGERTWNEHQRDAAAAGLAYLYDRKHPGE